jgi:chaperone required for assembly of F1-ATPase
MRDLLEGGFEPSDPNPMKRAQNAMARQPLPRRFYKEAAVVETPEGFAIALDGRPARTPGRRPLAAPRREAAEAIAAEWRAQGETIDPARMHATRIANTAIDSLGERIAEVQEDIAAYAGSDLVCYRAGEPEGLVQAQAERWDPIVAWAEESFGTRFVLAEGVMHQAQGEAALAAIRAAAARWREPIALAALHVMTTLTGSSLIALMAAEGALSGEDAWKAAIVDESWNASLWGWDEEAEKRLAARREEFLAAHGLLRALA